MTLTHRANPTSSSHYHSCKPLTPDNSTTTPPAPAAHAAYSTKAPRQRKPSISASVSKATPTDTASHPGRMATTTSVPGTSAGNQQSTNKRHQPMAHLPRPQHRPPFAPQENRLAAQPPPAGRRRQPSSIPAPHPRKVPPRIPDDPRHSPAQYPGLTHRHSLAAPAVHRLGDIVAPVNRSAGRAGAVAASFRHRPVGRHYRRRGRRQPDHHGAHLPGLLIQFAPEDALMAKRINDAIELTRLDPEQVAWWLGNCTPGQLWEGNKI